MGPRRRGRMPRGDAGKRDTASAWGIASPRTVTPRATGLDLFPTRVSDRTTWLFVRLSTNVGVTGVGEALFRPRPPEADGPGGDFPELAQFYEVVNESLSVSAYRDAGWPRAARGDIRMRTAFSAIEQALWDIRGKLEGVPIHELLGGQVRDLVGVYANINRMTVERQPAAFARSAELAGEAGFKAVKAAPFDGFPSAEAGAEAVEAATSAGVDAMLAIREAVGSSMAVKVDCHSHFDHDRAVSVANRLEPVDLDWFEEPLPVADVQGARALRGEIPQRLAGGESLFGREEFAPLIGADGGNDPGPAVDVVMPDVMLCGGVLEMLHIARAAGARGVSVSPHNACGPVATAASLAVCAAADNVESLELQWGEVDWRRSLIDPPEQVSDGALAVSDRPGFGVELRV